MGKSVTHKKAEIFRGIAGLGESPVLGRIFLGQVKPELAAGLEELVRTLLRLSLAHRQHPQISRLDSGGFENRFERIGIVPGKTVGIASSN